MTGASSSNLVCSHVYFNWTAPTSCLPITQYQVSVLNKNGSYRELPPVPGSANQLKVSNYELTEWPFDLKVGDTVGFKVRAYNKNGWGKWSAAQECADPNGKKAVNTSGNRMSLSDILCSDDKEWDSSKSKCVPKASQACGPTQQWSNNLKECVNKGQNMSQFGLQNVLFCPPGTS